MANELQTRLARLEYDTGRLLGRLAKAEAAVGSLQQATAGNRPFAGGLPLSSVVHVKTGGSAISPASSTTQMTSGTGTIYYPDAAGALTSSTVSVALWNKSTLSTFAANKHYLAARDDKGLLVLIWADC